MIQEARDEQNTADMREKRTRLATAKQRLEELETLLCRIYEDHLLGRLPDAGYVTLDAQYGKEQESLND